MPLALHMVIPWAPLHDPNIQLALSIPVYALGLWFFGKSAWSSIKTGVPNMDVLIFTGAASAFFYSIFGTLYYAGTHEVHNYLFYETGATIISLVLAGNMLEQRSVKKTTQALQSLSNLQPRTARMVVVQDGKETIVETEVSRLAPGDMLLVNSGDLLPIDGVVTEGNGECDESMLTGESMPVMKELESPVTGGTLLTSGNLKMRVTKRLRDSTLSQIIDMVKKAQANKPNIQRLGDKVSSIFVPAVISISAITFIVSYFFLDLGSAKSMLRAVAVLVISCPCAMGLATPTAIMVGIGKAAKRGILIKGGDVLENFAKSKVILFDKTGTLTTGKFNFSGFRFSEGEETTLKNLIWHMEQRSSHPIARMLVEAYPEWQTGETPFVQFNENKGLGLEATDALGQVWKLGSSRYTGIQESADLFLTCNGKWKASWSLQDEVKQGSAGVVNYFKGQEMETVLLSGDHAAKVKGLAEQLGIKTYLSEQLPGDKLNYISQKTATVPVAMVGDGVNDAPALSKVPVGISFAKGSDIAIQSANVVLMRPDIQALTDAHRISMLTYRTIKQNLFWAFFYNVLCIPLAAAGYMHPMVGALSMAFSDVIIIGNSLLLGTKKV